MTIFKKKELKDIPVPKKPFSDMRKDYDFPKYEPVISDFNVMKEKPMMDMMPPFESMQKSVRMEERSKSKKPIFIKIDKYEQATDLINTIKEKVKDIEHISDKLKQIKKEEDQALDHWEDSLNQIKDKLMTIEKNLFEYGN